MRTMKKRPPSTIGSIDLEDCLMESETLRGELSRRNEEGGGSIHVVICIDICRGKKLLAD
jgi:hypothetical protein